MDPKWLEVLKTSGWQAGSVAIVLWLFVLIVTWGWLPGETTAWLLPFVVLAAFVATGLAMATVAKWTFDVVASKIKKRLTKRESADAIKRRKEALRREIPHMDERERRILGYLLHKQQRTFTTAVDGGFATGLISRGIIVQTLIPGMSYDYFSFPAMVPEWAWEVMCEESESLPYMPIQSRHGERPPWVDRQF